MLSIFIILPMFVATLLCLWFLPDSDKWMVAFPLVLGTGAFMLRHAIDDWWRRRNPSRLDKMERNILSNFFPYYRALTPPLKIEFEQRVQDFNREKQFQTRGAKTLAGDIQLLLSATAVQLTFGQPRKREFYSNLGMIILYPKTFITPDFNEKLHAVEVNFDEKGYDSLFLAINMFAEGLKSVSYYQVALLGFARIWLHEKGYTEADFKTSKEEIAENLPLIRGLDWPFLEEYTAISTEEYHLAALLECFFQRPNQLAQALPGVFDALCERLAQNPTEIDHPVAREGGN